VSEIRSMTFGTAGNTIAEILVKTADEGVITRSQQDTLLERFRRSDPTLDAGTILKQAFDAEEITEREKNSLLARLARGSAAPPLQAAEMGSTATARSAVGGMVPPSTLFSPTVPYPAPFDWTDGIRKLPPPTPFGIPPGLVAPGLEDDAVLRALGYFRQHVGTDGRPELLPLYHQPLIQIKLRVIEVARADGLSVNSVLEYVSTQNKDPSLTSGSTLNTANGGHENLRGLTRFAVNGLISNATTGSGLLVNLTTQHINWIASFLATELNADVVTAPEVVTLNGQNVEFIAGSKLPFALGQNVIQGTNNNIQQVFYKHVGTMISVTPTIVNWGFHGEGEGEASISASEVVDWNALVEWMTSENGLRFPPNPSTWEPAYDLRQYLPQERPQILPFDLKSKLLLGLNEYTRSDLLRKGLPVQLIDGACGDGCKWKPEDCTIDLTLVVRLSEAATGNLELAPGAEPTVTSANVESNVRAVANVIQVKSGHGVVMAGLIGEREIEGVDKVPVLGDIPGLGFFFRSKVVERIKTEVLIFIEAQVLDPDPHIARAESADDFWLSGPYVAGALHDNPLECGLHRVGFGTYLPPHSHDEEVFWERHGRKVLRIETHIDDIFE
jgi:hypothetical protein